jgi:hypothetical protein
MRGVAALAGNMGTMLGPTVQRDCSSIGSIGGFCVDGTELDNRSRTFPRVAWCCPASAQSIAPGFLVSKRSGEKERKGKHACGDDELTCLLVPMEPA